jgi:hypothetical protein
MNYHIGRVVLSSLCVGVFGAAGFWWCSCFRLKPATRTPPNTSRTKNSNTQRTENKTTDVVIHQHSRKLQKMDILMSETCWAHNKWNKIASDIKLVFRSSNIRHVCDKHTVQCILFHHMWWAARESLNYPRCAADLAAEPRALTATWQQADCASSCTCVTYLSLCDVAGRKRASYGSNPLWTKLSYLKTQSVPRSKHSLHRL